MFDHAVQVGRVDGSTLMGGNFGSSAGHFNNLASSQGSTGISSEIQKFEGTSSFRTVSGVTAPLVSFSFEYFSDGLSEQTLATVQGVVVICEGCETILYLKPEEPPTQPPLRQRTTAPAANPIWGQEDPLGNGMNGPGGVQNPQQHVPGSDQNSLDRSPEAEKPSQAGSPRRRPGQRNKQQNADNEQSGSSSGGNKSGTAAGVTITLLLLIAAAVGGYYLYQRRKQEFPDNGQERQDNDDSERSWRGRFSMVAANAWLLVSSVRDRIIQLIPDRKEQGDEGPAPRRSSPDGHTLHQSRKSPMKANNISRNARVDGSPRPPPRPPNSAPTALALASVAAAGGYAPSSERYDDVVIDNRSCVRDDYGSNMSSTYNYGACQRTVVDYEDVRSEDVIEGKYHDDTARNMHYG